MTNFIPVQKPSKDVSTSAEIHLKTLNPTIVKEVETIYSQFSTQDRQLILEAAMEAHASNSLSDAAYTFIFNNAGIRKVLFD